jgi:cell fate regulator YaaT (PSP1 superfamily)
MEIVRIRFPQGPRPRACDARGFDLEVGTACLVETERGVEMGTVVGATLAVAQFDGGRDRLPRVLRVATREDEEAQARRAAGEGEARDHCLRRIEELGLAMKLGPVDRPLDGRRIVFYFTAEGRIDFRQLVRDLSQTFHTRIELKQIGEREDAGLRGGCGPCGRTLCCSTFLVKFDPISIKMAKSQGLSLNPSKISGMCGRLMCCLKYEYDPQDRSGGGKRGCDGCSKEPPSPPGRPESGPVAG